MMNAQKTEAVAAKRNHNQNKTHVFSTPLIIELFGSSRNRPSWKGCKSEADLGRDLRP
jgi:hypothetical protein